MSAPAYLVGRRQRTLDLSAPGAPQPDTLYASQRLDGQTLIGLTFSHTTFANVSFKASILTDCVFIDCVFTSCYFKKAQLTGCAFQACRFVDCNLEQIKLERCDFRYYADFNGCYIAYGEFESWLPAEPNLCSRLTHNLARACEKDGAYNDAKRYRQRAAQERERNWMGRVRGSNAHYQQHYGKLTQKLTALSRVIRSRVWGWSYGHGSSGPILARNFILLTALLFPFLLFLARSGIKYKGTSTSPAYPNLLVASLDNILPLAGLVDLRYTGFWPRFLLAAETAFGLFLVGLAVSLAFKTVIERSR